MAETIVLPTRFKVGMNAVADSGVLAGRHAGRSIAARLGRVLLIGAPAATMSRPVCLVELGMPDQFRRDLLRIGRRFDFRLLRDERPGAARDNDTCTCEHKQNVAWFHDGCRIRAVRNQTRSNAGNGGTVDHSIDHSQQI